MFALTGNLRLKPEALWFAWQHRYWSAEREREIGTVMALKAQRNLVLRLLVDNGVRERDMWTPPVWERWLDFSDASGNHGCWFELQLWKC